jgi:hypothetical protein
MHFANSKTCFDPAIDVILMVISPTNASMKSKNASKWPFTFWQVQVNLNICFWRISQTGEDVMNLKRGA